MSHVFDPETGTWPEWLKADPQKMASQPGLTGMANPFAPRSEVTASKATFWVPKESPVEKAVPTRFPSEKLASIASYIDHIVNKHHAYARGTLNTLAPMVEALAAEHGKEYPEFKALHTLFGHFHQEILNHLWQEETVIFPACVKMEADGTIPPAFLGRIQNPLSMMQSDHGATHEMLGQIHHLLATMVCAEDTCETYGEMSQSLWHLLEDLNVHLYKEDQILFPRVWVLREQLL